MHSLEKKRKRCSVWNRHLKLSFECQCKQSILMYKMLHSNRTHMGQTKCRQNFRYQVRVRHTTRQQDSCQMGRVRWAYLRNYSKPERPHFELAVALPKVLTFICSGRSKNGSKSLIVKMSIRRSLVDNRLVYILGHCKSYCYSAVLTTCT